MAAILPFLVILLAGIGFAVQAPTNATLARASGSVVLAALVSFAVGTLVLAAWWLAFDRTSPATLRSVPGWAWLGGLYGAGFVAAMAYGAPRLGLATVVTVAIASQLVAAVALDHVGALGLRATPAGPARIAGVAMVLAGVFLVRRG